MFVQICLEEFSSLTFARLNRGHRAEPRLICTAGTTASRNEQVFQIRGEINREKKTLLDFRATVRRNAYRSDASRTLLYKVFLVFPLSSARVYVCVSVCVCVYVRARVQMRRSIETSNSRSIRSVLRRRGEVFFFFFFKGKSSKPGGKLVDGVVCGLSTFGLSAIRVVVVLLPSQG